MEPIRCTSPCTRAGLFASAIAAAVAAGCASPTPQADDDPHIVDARNGAGQGCALALSGATAYIAYQGPFDEHGVYVARSDDGGASWPESGVHLVDADGIGAMSVAVDGAAIYVAYAGVYPHGDLRLARSDDGGATWTVKIVAGSANPTSSMAVSGGVVRVGYAQTTGTNMDLRFARSDDRGDSFPVDVVVQAAGNTGWPSLAVAPSAAGTGSALYLAYFDEATLTEAVTRSTDDGLTWTPAPGMARGAKASGDLFVAGGELFLPMADNGGAFLGRSADGGASWDLRPFALEGISGGIRAAGAGGVTYALFDRSEQSKSTIGLGRSTDGGATWPAADMKTLFVSRGNGSLLQHASLQIAGAGPSAAMAIAFFDGSSLNLKALRSADGGATWP